MPDKRTVSTERDSEIEDDLSKLLPPDLRQEIESAEPEEREMMLAAAVKSVQYTGPLPPGYMLREYEEVLPGAADRVFRMAEQQAEHRQYIEKQVVASKSRAELLGVIFAGMIVMATVVGGVFLIHDGQSIVGFGTLLAGIGGIAGTFIYGTRSEREERAAKRAQRDSE